MRRRVWILVIAGCALILATRGSVAANTTEQSSGLEGVWAMTLGLRDCASGAALGPPFRSLLTFHAGGTLNESPASGQFAPGQRSPGHGVWTQTGQATFRTRFAALVVFDTPPSPPASPGFQAGWQVVDSTMTLSGPGALSVTAVTEFYDLSRRVYRSACVAGTAENFGR